MYLQFFTITLCTATSNIFRVHWMTRMCGSDFFFKIWPINLFATKAERERETGFRESRTKRRVVRCRPSLASPRHANGCNEPLRRSLRREAASREKRNIRIETHALWRSAKLCSGSQLEGCSRRNISRVTPLRSFVSTLFNPLHVLFGIARSTKFEFFRSESDKSSLNNCSNTEVVTNK